MTHQIKIDLSFEQEAQLNELVERHNTVSGDNLTPDEILNRMMFLGQKEWFDERLNAIHMALNALELISSRKNIYG